MGSSRFNVFFPIHTRDISSALSTWCSRLKRRVEIVHGVVKDGFCKEFAKDIESNMCDKTSAE